MSDQPLNGDFGAPESRGTSQVAVVIPVRDGERYLRETIESVLAQTLVPAEVIVVDDGSTDSSASIAAGYRPSTRVVSQRAAGLPTALNRGVAETTAELVAMLDADDIWPPSKLELQASQLAADPGLDAVFGHMKSFLSPDLDAQERAKIAFRAEAEPFRGKGTMLIRRAALERVGPFDTDRLVGEFIDWHARADEAGLRTRMYDDVVLERRLHATNFSRSEGADRVDYVRVARAALQRRRARTE